MENAKEETVAEKSYWTITYYNASGFGVEQTWKNIYVASEAEAKDYAITNYRIVQGNCYRVYAFKQASRI